MGNVIKHICEFLCGKKQQSPLKEHLTPKTNNTHKSNYSLPKFSSFKKSMPSFINFNLTLQDFKILKTLGKGSFGKVFLVHQYESDQYFAMKVLNKAIIKKQNQIHHTKTEREILEKINHPFIVKLKAAFQTQEKLFLITDFMSGGELFYHLSREGRFREERVKLYACEIILALEHLHNNKIIYRDLKPENILLDEQGHIKLADFGLSKLLKNAELSGTFNSASASSMFSNSSRAYTICGTPKYLAPEILCGKGYDSNIDWWSLGVVIYEMLVGTTPFKDTNNKLDISIYSKPILDHRLVGNQAMSLIKGLLAIDPEQRLGINNTSDLNIKQHPFFEDINWTKVYNRQYKPAFVPIIKSRSDISNFDKIFTEEEPDFCNDLRLSLFPEITNKESNYENFTYAHNSILEPDNKV